MVETSTDAEIALVGGLLAFPETEVTVEPEWFGLEIARSVFDAIQTVRASGKRPDAVLVAKEIPDARNWMVEAIDLCPSSYNIPEYAEMVREGYIRRTVGGYADELRTAAMFGTMPEMLAATETLHDLMTASKADDEAGWLKGMTDFMTRVQMPVPQYIATGFAEIDKGMYLQPGDFIVIGARPSMGKTAIALQMAEYISRTRNTVFFSLETSAEKLYDRLGARVGQVSFRAIKRHAVSQEDMDKVEAETLRERKLTVVQAAGKSVAWIAAKARKLKAEVIFIDYLSLLSAKGKDEFERVTNVSRDLHVFAQTAKIAVFALSQLRRTNTEVPDLTDLRQSGQIEQDADAVLLLGGSIDTPDRSVLVAKNKEGQAGVVIKFRFNGDKQTFTAVDTTR